MDQIADVLIRIKNAQAVKKETVSIPYSKIKMEIVKIMVREKFLKGVEKKDKKNRQMIDIVLSYDKNGHPAIMHFARISKSSRRIYVPFKKIKYFRRGGGMQIISTSQGILTNQEAKKKKVGGEILCEIS